MSDDAGGTRPHPLFDEHQSLRRERSPIIRWPGKAALAAALGLAAALVVLPAAAFADGGTWGPNATPYRNGVVCDSTAVATALASWDGADGGAAFGLSPIQSGYGRTDEPSASGIELPVRATPGGLDATAIAQLAYLISAHGDDGSAGVVGDVAADVLQLAGTTNSNVDSCLASGIDGASPTEASALLGEAQRLAGPYSVNLSGPTTPTPSGQPIPLVARVLSAAGNPVPGLTVSFTPAGTGTQVSAASATTDANGEAQVDALTSAGGAAGASPASDAVTAGVQASTGLLETSTGGDVPLIEAAAAQQYTDRLALTVDTRPDPHLQLTNVHSLLLTGGQLAQTLTVTGMNGHLGTATVSLYGPLALTHSGCSTHTAADWAAAQAAHTVAEAPQVSVSGDGSVPVQDATELSPGCYQAVAALQTTDASPNVSAKTTGEVVTVAPVTVAAAPQHSGLAPVGSLHTVLRATSTLATTWQDVQGEVVGPRLSVAGQCPVTGWASASTVVPVTSTGASTSSESDTQTAGTSQASGSPTTATADGSGGAPGVAVVTAASGNVSGAGCYAFRLTATLRLPGIGSVTVGLTPGEQDTPVHVIAPTVSVTKLSDSGVDTGGHLAALVDVSSSDGQPGSLRLELLRLPYTYRGCFGADWGQASVVATPRAPVLPTKGDNTYRVSTAAVPGTACWTVVPVFTASANHAVRAQATAGDDPMLAFTSTVRPRSTEVSSATRRVDSNSTREIAVVAVVAAILLALLLSILIASRAGRRDIPIDARDQLLSPPGG